MDIGAQLVHYFNELENLHHSYHSWGPIGEIVVGIIGANFEGIGIGVAVLGTIYYICQRRRERRLRQVITPLAEAWMMMQNHEIVLPICQAEYNELVANFGEQDSRTQTAAQWIQFLENVPH